MSPFVHLHVHTQYSILDGQAAIPKLVEKAIADGMPGMAVTDHGNMMGIKEFLNYVNKVNDKRKKEGLVPFKPIVGCEMYVAPRHLTDKEKAAGDGANYHLLVLAKNQKGYHNLVKLVSKAWTQGFYSHPRTDRYELEKYHEGLIVCSACLGGEVPRKILSGRLDEAEEAIQWYKRVFGDDYYLELQLHKATVPRANHEVYHLQLDVNAKLKEYSRQYGVPLVCTNDVHFVDEENAEAHDRLICLSTGKDLDDPNRMLYSKQEWFKTTEEMNAIFGDVPEALSNTVAILDKVEPYSIDHAPIMPNFDIPADFGTEEEYRQKYTEEDLFNEFTRDEKGNVVLSDEEAHAKIDKLGGYDKLYRIKLEADYLRKLTFDGAKKVYPEMTPEIEDQLNFELHIMKTMGFPGYFLIVQDFIRAAREELGVWVGPGRGSAAGSAVAYCLQITRIDPIKYDLLFERFLNPDRISLPDIDVDFDDDGRGRVLQWVTDKYGQEKVAHIITYGTMATKLAIKDVARVQKVPLDVSNRLCKAIPDRLPDVNGKTPKMNLTNAIAAVPELQEAAISPDPLLRDTIKYAKMLEGNVRNTGVHACGTIICRDPITDWVPVSTAEDKESKEKLIVTQYEGSVIEDTGLIKMDFLGLKTLSILKEAVQNVKESLGIDVDVDTIPIDDPLTYKLYCEGRTIGTFQFESPGMQKYLRELQPSTFEDLIAMNALYRPGPMDYIPDFIDRKHGRKPIKYDIPVMEKYLKDTYGITVYQEQVMLLSRLLAGFTRGESDTLRKAMGKKLKDKLDKLKPKFINGGKANGHDEKILEKIWADWEKFASYAFNKSHATCYSWVAYQTAYMKAHYPAQYMAANLSRNLDKLDEITKLQAECKAMGIKVLGPDVNESRRKFSSNAAGNIRFGLGGIKGVGENAVEAVIAERDKNGPYKDIYDFVERVNLQACNRKAVENMALAGVFDSFGTITREQFFAPTGRNEEVYLDQLMRYGALCQTDKAEAQFSLFGDGGMVERVHPPIIDVPSWTDLERLDRERELVGMYLSAHPLDEYRIILDHVCNTHMADLSDLQPLQGRTLTLGGIVVDQKELRTKRDMPYGKVMLEDFTGTYELTLFGNDWMNNKGKFGVGYFLYIEAEVRPRKFKENELELAVLSIRLLPEVKDSLIHQLTVLCELTALEESVVLDMAGLVKSHPGKVKLRFEVRHPGNTMKAELSSRSCHVEVTEDLINYIKNYPGLDFRLN
ncbi:MAG: DNA polymerase III subunit alpha [Bacteroidaceae bacterium]|nr:DNA polymerase III subunit alpha [Bacteroidaceae bacterium]MBR4778648.1 DNA polymerase III subunit alpha [Bacteroidaceae bacterium]